MNAAGLYALRQVLEFRAEAHLDDEMLAMIATAEVSGEAVEAMYAAELAHIETCVACAEGYQALVIMLSDAVGDMTAAAALIPPAQLLAALLGDQLAMNKDAAAEYSPFIQQLVEHLPFVFTTLPTTPDEVTPSLISAAAPHIPHTLMAALTQAMQNNLAALQIYLQRVADSFWGQMVNLKTDRADSWHQIQLMPEARPQIALQHGQETGDTWQLFTQSIGTVPLTVTAWATRLTPLACALTIRADRPGLRQPAGRTIQLSYPGQTHRLQTGVNGEVQLAPVPIAALPYLKIQIGPES